MSLLRLVIQAAAVALFKARWPKAKKETFASIYVGDGERRLVDADEFKALLAGLNVAIREARALIESCAGEDAGGLPGNLTKGMVRLRDELDERSEAAEGMYPKFRRGKTDLETFFAILVEAQHLETVLAAALELQVSPAVLRCDLCPFIRRLRLDYINAEDERRMHGIDAVSYSVVGDRAYLFGVMDNEVFQFRVDRIQRLFEGRKRKPSATGADIHVWLLERLPG